MGFVLGVVNVEMYMFFVFEEFLVKWRNIVIIFF